MVQFSKCGPGLLEPEVVRPVLAAACGVSGRLEVQGICDLQSVNIRWFDGASFAVNDSRLKQTFSSSLDLSNQWCRTSWDGLSACPFVIAGSRVLMLSGVQSGECIVMDFTFPTTVRADSLTLPSPVTEAFLPTICYSWPCCAGANHQPSENF